MVKMSCVMPLTIAVRCLLGAQVSADAVRIGESRPALGLLQPFADVLSAGRSFHGCRGRPILSIAPAVAAWAVIPFFEGGAMLRIAMSSIGVCGVIIAGWANSICVPRLPRSAPDRCRGRDGLRAGRCADEWPAA
jgi:NADH-quinone oxidoreductase subunit H